MLLRLLVLDRLRLVLLVLQGSLLLVVCQHAACHGHLHVWLLLLRLLWSALVRLHGRWSARAGQVRGLPGHGGQGHGEHAVLLRYRRVVHQRGNVLLALKREDICVTSPSFPINSVNLLAAPAAFASAAACSAAAAEAAGAAAAASSAAAWRTDQRRRG